MLSVGVSGDDGLGNQMPFHCKFSYNLIQIHNNRVPFTAPSNPLPLWPEQVFNDPYYVHLYNSTGKVNVLIYRKRFNFYGSACSTRHIMILQSDNIAGFQMLQLKFYILERIIEDQMPDLWEHFQVRLHILNS